MDTISTNTPPADSLLKEPHAWLLIASMAVRPELIAIRVFVSSRMKPEWIRDAARRSIIDAGQYFSGVDESQTNHLEKDLQAYIRRSNLFFGLYGCDYGDYLVDFKERKVSWCEWEYQLASQHPHIQKHFALIDDGERAHKSQVEFRKVIAKEWINLPTFSREEEVASFVHGKVVRFIDLFKARVGAWDNLILGVLRAGRWPALASGTIFLSLIAAGTYFLQSNTAEPGEQFLSEAVLGTGTRLVLIFSVLLVFVVIGPRLAYMCEFRETIAKAKSGASS